MYAATSLMYAATSLMYAATSLPRADTGKDERNPAKRGTDEHFSTAC
jgi:hypothetical protein